MEVNYNNIVIKNNIRAIYKEKEVKRAILFYAKKILGFKLNKPKRTLCFYKEKRKNQGYVYMSIGNKSIKVHKILMCYKLNGEIPKEYAVTFKDKNTKNLFLNNLKLIKKSKLYYNTPKGTHRSIRTEFPQGHLPSIFKGYKIKHIHKEKGGKRAYITLGEEKEKAISRKREYKRSKRTTYAQYLMNPPAGYVVYHKDRNALNDLKKNLEVISRGELMKRNFQNRKS